MLFNSLHFLIFFPIVVMLHFAIPRRYRWVLLLLASYYFYLSFRWEYVYLIFVSTASAYVAGYFMSRTESNAQRKFWVGFSLVFNIGLLFFFKYFDFFMGQMNIAFERNSLDTRMPLLEMVLPIGISFYTFQAVGYTMDVYWRKHPPEKSFGIFATYVAFFPQLVAGPIERAGNLIPQFHKDHKIDYDRMKRGLLLMLWGYFQKIVIADNAGRMVDYVYADVNEFGGLALILVSLFSIWQMYCDLAGYTDIARGAAQVMGFNLMINLNRPFSATSISDFFRRWHISLSTWALDYIFKPTAYNKRHWGQGGVLYAVFLTFMFFGIWHGPKWAYMIFGASIGLAFYYELLTQKYRKRASELIPGIIYNPISRMFTFGFFVIISVFFRTDSLKDALYVMGNYFTKTTHAWYELGMNRVEVIAVAFFILLLEGVHYMQRKGSMRDWILQQHWTIRWILYIGLIGVILNFGAFDERPFIYFQF